MVLEKGPRVLHCDPQAAGGDCITLGIARTNETSKSVPIVRPYLLIVSLPMGQTFKHVNLLEYTYAKHLSREKGHVMAETGMKRCVYRIPGCSGHVKRGKRQDHP